MESAVEPTIAFRQDSYARKQLLSSAFEWGYQNPTLDPRQKNALDPVYTRYRAKMESYLLRCLELYRANPNKTYSPQAAHQAELSYMADLERELRMVANPGEIRTAIIRGQELAAQVGPELQPTPRTTWLKEVMAPFHSLISWGRRKKESLEETLTLQQAIRSGVNRNSILRIAERELLADLNTQAA